MLILTAFIVQHTHLPEPGMNVNEKIKASDAFKILVKIVIRMEHTLIIKLQTPIGTGIF
jgi:hypothetical protein